MVAHSRRMVEGILSAPIEIELSQRNNKIPISASEKDGEQDMVSENGSNNHVMCTTQACNIYTAQVEVFG